jgi:hypothetical protein
MTEHKTRIGKIARLSHDIREQLNTRLRDGEPAQTILDWLNAIPGVQAVLDSQFDSHPISEQNLSEWRHGGFRDWLTRQDALTLLRVLQDKDALGHEELSGPISDKLARWAALQYAAAAQSLLASQPDPAAHWSRLRELCADISCLRRNDLSAERLVLERDWLALETSTAKQQTEKAFWAWTKRPEISKKLRPNLQGGIPMKRLRQLEKELNLM